MVRARSTTASRSVVESSMTVGAAGACSNLNITVPGAFISDLPILGVQATSVPANGSFSCCMGSGLVTVRFTNNDRAIAYDPPAGFFRVLVLRTLP